MQYGGFRKITFPNGVYNLITQQLLSPAVGDIMTRIMPYPFVNNTTLDSMHLFSTIFQHIFFYAIDHIKQAVCTRLISSWFIIHRFLIRVVSVCANVTCVNVRGVFFICTKNVVLIV